MRGDQYKTEANLAARQSVYAFARPRIDLQARVLDLAAPAPAGTIVEVGCGNGTYLAELARRGFAGRVIGVDLSFGILAAARDRLSGTERPAPANTAPANTVPANTVALANADATALPLGDGAADLALAAHMLYHVPQPADAVRELRRVTRPGGRVVVVLNGGDHLHQLRAAVAAARDDATAIRERLTLDDGESLAKSFFPKVARHDFVAELRVPGPGPIADYVRSLSGTIRHANPDHVAKTVVATLPKTPDGHYVITSHSGCLICEAG